MRFIQCLEYLKVIFGRWAQAMFLPNTSGLKCSCFIVLIFPHGNVKQNSVLWLL